MPYYPITSNFGPASEMAVKAAMKACQQCDKKEEGNTSLGWAMNAVYNLASATNEKFAADIVRQFVNPEKYPEITAILL